MTPEAIGLLCVGCFLLGMAAYHFMFGGPR